MAVTGVTELTKNLPEGTRVAVATPELAARRIAEGWNKLGEVVHWDEVLVVITKAPPPPPPPPPPPKPVAPSPPPVVKPSKFEGRRGR